MRERSDYDRGGPSAAANPALSTPADEARVVRFGAFSLDLDAAELLCNGAPISIRATPLRVLVALARRIGQIVPKQQLLDEVWPHVAVTDASLSTALRELRQTLGDDGRRQQWIQTLRHRGVRLVPPRSETRRPETAAAADGVAERHQALLARLGAALFDGGHQDEARAAYHAAARVAQSQRDHAGFVRAVLGFASNLGSVVTGISSAEQVALLEEAIAFETAVPPAERARLRVRLASSLAWSRRDEALALASDAVLRAREAGDPATLGAVLHDAYWVLWSPDNLADRCALVREMIEAGEAAGDPFATGIAHQLDSATRLERGDRAAAEAASERADRGVRTRAHAAAPAWRSGWHACMALLDGRFREAEHHANQAFRSGHALGSPHAARIHALQLGLLRFDQGRLGELDPFASRIDSQLPIGRAAAALIHEAAGRRDVARREFTALVSALDTIPRNSFWLGTLTLLAELAVRLADADRAAILYEALEPYEAQCVVIGSRSACRGSVALPLGLLARVAGRREGVVSHLESAVRVHAGLRALPLLARAQFELARALCERARDHHDLVRARTLLSASADVHRGLGLVHHEDSIAALQERLCESVAQGGRGRGREGAGTRASSAALDGIGTSGR